MLRHGQFVAVHREHEQPWRMQIAGGRRRSREEGEEEMQVIFHTSVSPTVILGDDVRQYALRMRTRRYQNMSVSNNISISIYTYI